MPIYGVSFSSANSKAAILLVDSNLSLERASIVGNCMQSEASDFMPPKCVFTLYDKYGYEMECFRHSQIKCNQGGITQMHPDALYFHTLIFASHHMSQQHYDVMMGNSSVVLSCHIWSSEAL